MVGKTGFEPATPWSQTKRSTKLSHFPKHGAPEGIRTPDLLVRSQTLYPAELRARIPKANHYNICIQKYFKPANWLKYKNGGSR